MVPTDELKLIKLQNRIKPEKKLAFRRVQSYGTQMMVGNYFNS